MDFFEAQARAKKRTSRLVWLFALAVVGTIAAGYFVAVFTVGTAQQYRPNRARSRSNSYYETAGSATTSLWQPKILAAVTLGTFAVVGLASLYKWHQYSGGGSSVAESVGAKKIDSNTTNLSERRLLNVVEEMAIASGTPIPEVYVLDNEPAINAFAAGLTTSDAAVCVTRGTMEKLTRDELQGVIAHEFSHILNGDMRLNLRLAAIIFGILVIGISGRGILSSVGRIRTSSRDSRGAAGAVAFAFGAGLAAMCIGYIGYFFGRLIQAAVSRQREFLADASAVQFTRNPTGITGALKKIGGYALGSSLQTSQATAIGHFFFAQGFRSAFGGLWATHPPLAERIRAIDPAFDGQMFEPPEVVDVAHESFVAAGLVPALPPKRGSRALAGHGTLPDPAETAEPTADPLGATVSAVAAIGTLTTEQLANAQLLLDATPAALRAATKTPTEAAVLLYGLLLDAAPAIRAHQRSLIASRAGGDALRRLDEFEPQLRQVRDAQKLPLVQLALPVLRTLPPTALAPFLDTLDELVHADGRVSPFEFALQKLLIRTLALGRAPGAAVVQIYSFNAVIDEISVVLSVLARATTRNPEQAADAFAAGATQLGLIEQRLSFLDESAADLATLDAALDELATASPAIKQRTLLAAAHVVSDNGQVLVTEFELLRAIAATLDCPMPPLVPAP